MEINKEFLALYYGEMVNDVGEIFFYFLKEIPGDLDDITSAIVANNVQLTVKLLHRMAPCFYSVGLPQLTATAKKIEEAVADTWQIVPEIFADFKTEVLLHLPAVQAEYDRLSKA